MLRNAIRSEPRPSSNRSRGRRRPTLERLEGRALLSTLANSPDPAAPVDVHQAGILSSHPIVDRGQLPYRLSIDPVSMPNLPALQSMVAAQWGAYWVFFGGRTNGLHNFDPPPAQNFPPRYQNRDIIVVNSRTGRVWTASWEATHLPADVKDALTSTNQQDDQVGSRLYVAGGYGVSSATNTSTTFDTLTSINVPGLIRAVIQGRDVVRGGQVHFLHDARVQVTGGEMDHIGNRTYLVLGQAYLGNYDPSGGQATQIYTDQVRSFVIRDNGRALAIQNYQTQTDRDQFHRRDYTLTPAVFPNGRSGLIAHGGVFTPDTSEGYLEPILIQPNGQAVVDRSFQQLFSQYANPAVTLFDRRDRSLQSIFLGGISQWTYDPSTGQIAEDTNLPFIDTITTDVRAADGTWQEYILPARMPGLLGAEARFLASPNVAAYPNGVILLDAIRRPTVLGYLYGGIQASQPNFGSSTASAQLFRITLTPRAKAIG